MAGRQEDENDPPCRGRACPCPRFCTYAEYGQGNRKGCPYKSCFTSEIYAYDFDSFFLKKYLTARILHHKIEIL
jgi:hypothetical protein